MNPSNEPLVSIVTPVYNCEPYIAECIESVLAQTYSNWEYLILNNCSTDGTLKVIQRYAQSDNRIRVIDNDVFLGVIANHNKAFRSISPSSKYCKVVCGDDSIFPECVARLVELAESHPNVGVVVSYQVSGGADGWYVRTDGLPYYATVVPGREIGRAHLLGTLAVLGNPTSSLYRADLVRRTDDFFPNPRPEADTSACFECLKVSDFGFVHQALSFERRHDSSMTAGSLKVGAYSSNKLLDLRTYGPFYLTDDELVTRAEELLDEYYRFLALCAVNLRGKEFWRFHKERLKQVGRPLDSVRLGKAVSAKLLDLLLNPKQTVERVLRRLAPPAKRSSHSRESSVESLAMQ